MNGLTEDWLEVGQVCRRLDEERSVKGKGKMRRDDASSRQEGPAKLDVEALVREAYKALKAMVDEEERSHKQTDYGDSKLVDFSDKSDMDQAEAKKRNDGTMGEGVEQDALSTCRESPTEEEVGSGEEPSRRILETPADEPMCRHETGEKEGTDEESWHDASEGRWETACEEAKDEAALEKEEMRGGSKGSGIGNRLDRESVWLAFRFGWSSIRTWIIRLKPAQDRKTRDGL